DQIHCRGYADTPLLLLTKTRLFVLACPFIFIAAQNLSAAAQSSETAMQLTYNPEIFSVRNVGEAKAIILTAETSTTEVRWEQETPLLCGLIEARTNISPETVVLDYGCGIGRIAKALIERHGCSVVGVDISPSMRALSVEYVGSDRFFACAPEMLGLLTGAGLRFDLAISVWVLQHCLMPADDIGLVRDGLRPGGRLFVVNNV